MVNSPVWTEWGYSKCLAERLWAGGIASRTRGGGELFSAVSLYAEEMFRIGEEEGMKKSPSLFYRCNYFRFCFS